MRRDACNTRAPRSVRQSAASRAAVALFGVLAAAGCPEDQPALRREDCRCQAPSDASAAVTDITVSGGTSYMSLECGCLFFPCPGSLSEALRDACIPDFYGEISLTRGCGKASVRHTSTLLRDELVFDERTGALLGYSANSDAPEAPCDTSALVAGDGFDCASVTTCDLCPGASDFPSSNLPACE
jgi:hypothetical protein